MISALITDQFEFRKIFGKREMLMTHFYDEKFSDWSADKDDEFHPGHYTSAVIFHQILTTMQNTVR